MSTLPEPLQEIEQIRIERRWRRLGVAEPEGAATPDPGLVPRVAARAEVAVELVRQLLSSGRLDEAETAAQEALVQITEARQLLGGLAGEQEWQLELALSEFAELRMRIDGDR